MNNENLVNGLIILLSASIFSGVGVLIFLAIKNVRIPAVNINVESYVFQFVFSVVSGVITFL